MERFAGEEEKTRLQETLPARARGTHCRAARLSAGPRRGLPGTRGTDEALQAKVFEVARLTPIEQPLAFKAIYRVLLDREAGPKAGNLLAFLDPAFVTARFEELPFTREEFWQATAISMADLESWLAANREKIAGTTYTTGTEGSLLVLEITVTMTDGKNLLKRVRLDSDTRPPDFLGSTSGGLLA